MWFANDFHSWLCHSRISLANPLTCDQEIIIYSNSCSILCIQHFQSWYWPTSPRIFQIQVQNGWSFNVNLCVSFSVGQCGNQIGYRFWDLALREHAQNNKVNFSVYHCNGLVFLPKFSWAQSVNLMHIKSARLKSCWSQNFAPKKPELYVLDCDPKG